MILAVISRRLARIFRQIDRGLGRVGRRCCVARSERRLDRAKLNVGG
jgi:hypothetical protein